MNFPFTDRTSYLAWRQEWKTNYAKLSNDIRGQKRGRKQYLRTYQTIETNRGKVRQLISKTTNPEHGNFQQWQLFGLQLEARTQLEILVEAKVLSSALAMEARKQRAAQEPPPVVSAA